MNNKLLLLILLAPLSIFSQAQTSSKVHPFFSFDSEAFKYAHSGLQPGASASAGIKIDANNFIIAGSLGALVTPLNTGGTYIPYFFQATSYMKNKISPSIRFRVGYGGYKNSIKINNGTSQPQTIETRFNGLFLQPGLGLHIPNDKGGVSLIVSYIRSTFTAKDNAYGSYSYKPDGFSVSLGISI